MIPYIKIVGESCTQHRFLSSAGLRTLAASLLAVAVLLGCASSEKPLTRGEFVAKANAICRRVIDEVDWQKIPVSRLVSSAASLGKLEERASSELAELKAPADIEMFWQAMVEDFRVTGQQFEQLAAETKASKAMPSVSLEPVLNMMRERRMAAKSSGLEQCAVY